jgi:hypothetical protein
MDRVCGACWAQTRVAFQCGHLMNEIRSEKGASPPESSIATSSRPTQARRDAGVLERRPGWMRISVGREMEIRKMDGAVLVYRRYESASCCGAEAAPGSRRGPKEDFCSCGFRWLSEAGSTKVAKGRHVWQFAGRTVKKWQLSRSILTEFWEKTWKAEN